MMGRALITCAQWQLGQPGGHSRPPLSLGQSSWQGLSSSSFSKTATTSATTCGMPVICTAVIPATRRMATKKSWKRRTVRPDQPDLREAIFLARRSFVFQAMRVGVSSVARGDTTHWSKRAIVTKGMRGARTLRPGGSGTEGRVTLVFALAKICLSKPTCFSGFRRWCGWGQGRGSHQGKSFAQESKTSRHPPD